MTVNKTDIESMMACLEKVFREVRPLLLESAGNIMSENKKDGSPVTAIDKQVEELVIAEMMRDFPTVSVYGEETGYDSGLQGSYWLIDPIDGTSSFIINAPTFTNMAVYIEDDMATACVIYNPSSDEMFTAIKDNGAYKNGKRLNLQASPLPSTALCKGRDVAGISAILASKKVTGFVAPDGAGNAFSLVADGKSAAKFSLHSKGQIHDYAPGALLVTEAGGVVIPILDEQYRYDTLSFVACHPDLQSIVMQELQAIKNLED